MGTDAKPGAGQERITAAAIREAGVVYTGPHHAAIIHYIVKCAGIKPVTGEQGFVTSDGRFVSRGEALAVATASGQVDPSMRSIGGLLSEMLWNVPEQGWELLTAAEAFIRDRGLHDGPHFVAPPSYVEGTVHSCAGCDLAYIQAEAAFDAVVQRIEEESR